MFLGLTDILHENAFISQCKYLFNHNSHEIKINFLIDNQDGLMNKSIVDGDSERITKYENIHRKRLQCYRTIDVEGNEQ